MYKGRAGWTRFNTGARDRHPDCGQLKIGTDYKWKLAKLLKGGNRIGRELMYVLNRLYCVSIAGPCEDATETE
jgi:hypothetical protein